MRIRGWKIAGLGALAVALGAVFDLRQEPRLKTPVPFRKVQTASRKVFPYSVIPGGAASGAELQNALFHDSAAALHYADFRLERTRVESLREPRKVFVSYRIADRIYWTRKRLPLPKDETILTDGVSSARTRCGNRISEIPREPVNALQEPEPGVLDAGVPKELEAAANWNGETEPADSWAEKLEPGTGPPRDFLSSFGPQSLSSMSSPSSKTPASKSAGNKSSAVNSESSANHDYGSDKFQSAAALSTSTGSISPAIASRNVVSPTGAPPNFTATQRPVFRGYVSYPRFQPMVDFPEEVTERWTPDSPVKQTESHSSIAAFSHSSPSHNFFTHQVQPDTIPNARLNEEAPVPEPRTVVLTLCGIAVLLFPILKNGYKRRRLR